MAEHHERMSVIDTAWLRMDVPGNSAMIVSVLATATRMRKADLRKVVVSRLLCFPRFRRRPVADPLGASWIDDAAFDLDAHLIVTRLPEPAGKSELQALASRLAGEPLDPARPLWQIHFVERYGPGSAWVLRVHHCYADGMAMLRVLLSLTEQDPGPSLAATQATAGAATRRRPPAREPPAEVPARRLPLVSWLDHLTRPAADILESALAEGARLLEGGVHRAFHPDDTAALAAQAGGMVGELAKVLALPDDPPTALRGTLSGTKVVAWSDPLELAEVRTLGRALGGTVNDVLMATVAGALGSHLRAVHGCDTTALVLRASVPVNLRAAEEPTTLGNRFGLVFVDLPVGTRDPLQRVFRVTDTMRTLKGSLQPPMTFMVLGLLGMMPARLQTPAIELFSRKGTIVASNVPGPQAPLHLCGQRISEMYFWVPQSGSIGIGVSLLSYAGRVFVGVIADQALVAEPQALVDQFAKEFERLVLATTVAKLSSRRDGTRRRRTRRRKTTPAAIT